MTSEYEESSSSGTTRLLLVYPKESEELRASAEEGCKWCSMITDSTLHSVKLDRPSIRQLEAHRTRKSMTNIMRMKAMMRVPKNLQTLIRNILFKAHQNTRVHLIQTMGMTMTVKVQREAITSLTTSRCATSACHTSQERRSQF
jgi:hypothetical protein